MMAGLPAAAKFAICVAVGCAYILKPFLDSINEFFCAGLPRWTHGIMLHEGSGGLTSGPVQVSGREVPSSLSNH
jgi:hypothetical protein